MNTPAQTRLLGSIRRWGSATLAALCAAPALGGMPAFSGISAAANTAETSITNPAGMSRLGEQASSLRLVFAQGFGEFEVDESRTSTGGGDPDSDNAPVIAPLGFHVRQISEDVHAGISFTVPSGFGSEYGSDWAGRYYTDNYALVYLAVTPALSWRINPQWSVGVALGINYTLTASEVAINNLGPADGSLQAELDGIGTNVSVSALWQMSERTRFGLVYATEATADLEGKLDFKNAGPALVALAKQGRLGEEIEIENTLPQRMNAGVYHELDSGAYATFDVLWMDFSEFGTSSVSMEGNDLQVDESGAFEDFWGMAIGYGFPVRNGRRYSVGAFYMSSPVDDDERSLALPLDSMWGIGVGVRTTRPDGSIIDVNVNLADFGEAPVDTGPAAVRGRVVGETETPYGLILDAAYHF